TGTGTVDVQIVVPGLVEQAVAYELAFENAAPWGDSAAVRYTLTNETTGAVVAEGDVGAGRTEIPPLEGFVVDLDMPGQVAVAPGSVRFEGKGGTFTPVVLPASTSGTVGSRFVALPADFAVHFTDAVADTSLRLTFGTREIPVPFYVENTTTGARADFIVIEDVDSLR